jgi:hypothetical protein
MGWASWAPYQQYLLILLPEIVVFLHWPCVLVDFMCAYDAAKKTPLEER